MKASKNLKQILPRTRIFSKCEKKSRGSGLKLLATTVCREDNSAKEDFKILITIYQKTLIFSQLAMMHQIASTGIYFLAISSSLVHSGLTLSLSLLGFSSRPQRPKRAKRSGENQVLKVYSYSLHNILAFYFLSVLTVNQALVFKMVLPVT